jgi:hypothetical protein
VFRALELGATGGLLREVKSGVAAGERVVIGPYRTLRALTDGALVREASSSAP